MSVQAVFISERIVSPQRLAQRICGDDPASVSGKCFQQRVFFGSEGDRHAVFYDFGAAEINGTCVELKQGGLIFKTAAENR